VITSATLNGSYGEAHHVTDKAAAKILHPNDNFALTGEGYETRGKKFCKTVATFAKASSSLGMGVATVAMAPVDFTTGRGTVRPEGERKHFMDEGIAGNLSRFGVGLATGTCEVLGAVVGAGGAVVSLPARASSGQSNAEWIEGGALGGSQAAGKASAHTLGTPTGLALDLIRVPSLGIKVATASAAAVAGGTLGIPAGLIRFVFNK
jgi:hypothetical protein